jgi:hypothetical protein
MPRTSAAPRRRWATLLPLLLTLLILPGCYTYHMYQVGGVEGREGGNQPGTEWRTDTRHALVWGAIRQDVPVDNCRTVAGQRLGIEEINVRHSILSVVATVATLGFWAPLQVRWKCARPAQLIDTLSVAGAR